MAELTLRRLALFPSAFFGFLALAALAPVLDGKPPSVELLLAFSLIAVSLSVLYRWSYISLDGERIVVRFFGLRATALRWGEIREATFGMAFPSLAYAIKLRGRGRDRVLFHGNMWRQQDRALRLISIHLVKQDIPMDKGTAYVVGKALDIPSPKATIVHRPLFNRDKTY